MDSWIGSWGRDWSTSTTMGRPRVLGNIDQIFMHQYFLSSAPTVEAYKYFRVGVRSLDLGVNLDLKLNHSKCQDRNSVMTSDQVSSDIWRVAQLCCAKIPGAASVVRQDASDHLDVQILCSLWSGKGHIYKITVPSHAGITFIIKHVTAAPLLQSWGDRRKADSYQVEANFYDRLAPRLLREFHVRIPTPWYVERNGGPHQNEIAIGMSFVHSTRILPNEETARAVLRWLAAFHASHWGMDTVDQIVESVGLQKQGSYWYLDTRPDEHESMPNTGWEGRLKRAARAIDSLLGYLANTESNNRDSSHTNTLL